MFVLTWFTKNAKTHVIIWTAFVYVSELTVVAFWALIFHEFFTDFDIVTEIALITIRTVTHVLKFITWLDFTSVMHVWASLTAFTMDKLFAYTIFSELMRIWSDGLILVEIACIIEPIINPWSLTVVVKRLHGHVIYRFYIIYNRAWFE